MKRCNIRRIACISLLCASMTGCVNTGSKESTFTESSENAFLPAASVNSGADGASVIKPDMSYNAETDGQPWYPWGYAAESAGGLYFIGNVNNILYVLPENAEKAVPLCNRPDCSHDNTGCNAFIGGGGTVEGFSNSLYYFEDAVYMAGIDSNSYINLYRFHTDGSGYDKVMKLYRHVEEETGNADESNVINSWNAEYPNIILHRGYVYYYERESATTALYRQKIGSGEREIVYEAVGEMPQIFRTTGSDTHIFFQAGNFLNKEGTELNIDLMSYDIKKGNVSMVKKNVFSTYTICGDDLYYSNLERVYHFSLSDATDEIFCEIQGLVSMSADQKKVYIATDDTLYVYDRSGTKLASIGVESVQTYMGHNDRIFAVDANGLKVCDTSDAGKRSLKWQRIKV